MIIYINCQPRHKPILNKLIEERLRDFGIYGEIVDYKDEYRATRYFKEFFDFIHYAKDKNRKVLFSYITPIPLFKLAWDKRWKENYQVFFTDIEHDIRVDKKIVFEYSDYLEHGPHSIDYTTTILRQSKLFENRTKQTIFGVDLRGHDQYNRKINGEEKEKFYNWYKRRLVTSCPITSALKMMKMKLVKFRAHGNYRTGSELSHDVTHYPVYSQLDYCFSDYIYFPWTKAFDGKVEEEHGKYEEVEELTAHLTKIANRMFTTIRYSKEKNDLRKYVRNVKFELA